jgi:hypothetical protein
MSNPLRTPEDYELFLYTLAGQFPAIERSTLALVRRGASLARVSGELFFSHRMRLTVRERILFDRLPATIDEYGYEVWRGDEKLCWYDAQPHPTEPSLAPTHPHHKHVPPDMKRTRIPAPQMSFSRPNVPILIAEIEELIKIAAQKEI